MSPDAALVADLAELRRRDRCDRRVRTAVAAVMVLIAAVVVGPVLLSIPARVLSVVIVLVLAVVGAGAVVRAAYTAARRRYELPVCHPWIWRWRVVRRWYAPGETVWRDPWDGPLAVLDWHTDPACATPWVLVYDGTPRMSGGAAEWLPLDMLTPEPPGLPAEVSR